MSANSRTFGSARNRADESFWNYSVPQNENNTTSDIRGWSAEKPYSQPQHPFPSQASPPQSNQGRTLSAKTSSDSFSQRQSDYSSGLKAPRAPFREQDRASSGNDSLLDMYHSIPATANHSNGTSSPSMGGQVNGQKRVASRERSKVKRKGSRGGASTISSPPTEVIDEESKWIHRDKLAQIESRELAEMGVRVGRPSRANSRTKSVKTTKSTTDAQEPPPELPEEEDGVTRQSQGLQQVVDEDVQESKMRQEADDFANHVSQRSEDRTPVTRPGTSRIPIPKGSLYDDDLPFEMRGKRSESFGTRQQRTRSRSGGSQHLLDGVNGASAPTSPQQGSPPKQRVTSKGTLASIRKPSGPRKTSGPNARSRANSTTDSPKRPTTSGGPRPTTARPEGEAPWIATMYKPDPLLPQEEQMLPTHAKRMAQLKAEAEGKAARDNETSEFTLVDDQEDEKENQNPTEGDPVPDLQISSGLIGKRSSIQQKRSSLQEKRDSGQWPLRSASQQANERRLSPRPEAGYNLMPHVPTNSNNDPEKRSSIQTRTSHRTNGSYGNLSEEQRTWNERLAPSQQPVTLHPEKERPPPKKEKGCGCCVVM